MEKKFKIVKQACSFIRDLRVYALGHINDDFRLVISGENVFESMAFLA